METINNYNELVKYIKSNNLNVAEATELISLSMKVWITKEYEDVSTLLKVLDNYWNEWKDCRGELPLFIDDFDISDIYNDQDKPMPKRFI
jgi:hypothetical protein